MNRDLQIGTLRTFVNIVDLGGFSRAAEVMHITQPAVSQHIRRLESVLKQPVFSSTGRNLRLSPAGEELLCYARRIIALNDDVVARFTPPAGTVKLTLGISDQFTNILPDILRSLKRQADDVQVSIRTGLSESLTQQIEGGAVDLALIVSNQTAANAKYETEHIGRIEMDWFGRPAMAKDAALPLVMFTEPSSLRGRVLRAVQESGVSWRIGYEGPELIGLRAAIQAGFGVGCLIANAGDLWGLPTAISPDLPAPPASMPLDLAVTSRVPGEIVEATLTAFRSALRDYPIKAAA